MPQTDEVLSLLRHVPDVRPRDREGPPGARAELRLLRQRKQPGWPRACRGFVAFGGGATLDAFWGYATPETTIAAYDLERNDEKSAFAQKHLVL